MTKISRIIAIALLPLSAQMSWAGDRDAILGGAIGGVIGSIVGSQIGGRDGAVVGAGIGAAAGVAITANNGRHYDERRSDYGYGNGYERVRYGGERCRDDDRGYRVDYRGHYDRGYYADRGDRDAYRVRYYH